MGPITSTSGYARGNKLAHLEFLEVVLSDEVARQGTGSLGEKTPECAG